MRSIGVLVALLLVGGVARAQPELEQLTQSERTALAKQHFATGLADYNLRAYASAITEFEQGYAILPLPLFLFNVGQAARQLGDASRAIASYRRYLAEETNRDAPELSQAERYIEQLTPVVERAAAAKVAEPPPVAVAAPAPPPPPKRSRRWLWITIGVVGAVVVAGAVTAAVVLTRPAGPPSTTLGNVSL
jgi:hypothetical protein